MPTCLYRWKIEPSSGSKYRHMPNSNNERQTSRINIELDDKTYDLHPTLSYNSLLDQQNYRTDERSWDHCDGCKSYCESISHRIRPYSKKERNLSSNEHKSSGSITQRRSVSPTRTSVVSLRRRKSPRLTDAKSYGSDSSFERERKMYESHPNSRNNSHNRVSTSKIAPRGVKSPVEMPQRPQTHQNFIERGILKFLLTL